LKRVGVGAEAVAHDFRSSFRDWRTTRPTSRAKSSSTRWRTRSGASRATPAPQRVREAALMELWCDYSGDDAPEGKVILIAKARA
jgi:hypothetical protein